MTKAAKQPTGRAAETRARLLRVARTAFAAKGYDGTNLVSDVLEPAAVSAGSFYHQFSSKAELYEAVVLEAAHSWGSPFEALATSGGPMSFADITRASFATVFHVVDQNEDLVRIQLRDREHEDPAVSRPLRALREGWIAALSRMYRGLTTDPGATAEVIVALVIGSVAIYLDIPKARRAAERERMVENLTTFTVGGFQAMSKRPRKSSSKSAPTS